MVAELRMHVWQHGGVQLVDDRHAGQVVQVSASEVEPVLERGLLAGGVGQRNVDIGGAQKASPSWRGRSPQRRLFLRTCGHALLELRREAI